MKSIEKYILEMLIIYYSASTYFSTYRSTSRTPNIMTYIYIYIHMQFSNLLSLTLKEECKLQVLENNSIRKVSRPKKDEVSGQFRAIHDEELSHLLLFE
jgi:hypothetical protein